MNIFLNEYFGFLKKWIFVLNEYSGFRKIEYLFWMNILGSKKMNIVFEWIFYIFKKNWMNILHCLKIEYFFEWIFWILK